MSGKDSGSSLQNQEQGEGQGVEVRSYFVRQRNVLLVRGEMGELFVNYYLHLAQHSLRYAPEGDAMLKDYLAALTLHCASRPWHEHHAWTINVQEPLMNLFVVGNNQSFGLAGTIFTQHVKEGANGLFCAELVPRNGGVRRSSIDFDRGADAFSVVERFYEKSEQRLARFFALGPEDYVLITAQPECDEAWLRAQTVDTIRSVDERETLSLLERRFYHWNCGCSQQRMIEMLLPLMRQSPEELFGDEAAVRLSCPRCSARYVVSREALEAELVASESER